MSLEPLFNYSFSISLPSSNIQWFIQTCFCLRPLTLAILSTGNSFPSIHMPGLAQYSNSNITSSRRPTRITSCSTLCNPMDCSPPGSFVHGILQARILQWVAKKQVRIQQSAKKKLTNLSKIKQIRILWPPAPPKNVDQSFQHLSNAGQLSHVPHQRILLVISYKGYSQSPHFHL